MLRSQHYSLRLKDVIYTTWDSLAPSRQKNMCGTNVGSASQQLRHELTWRRMLEKWNGFGQVFLLFIFPCYFFFSMFWRVSFHCVCRPSLAMFLVVFLSWRKVLVKWCLPQHVPQFNQHLWIIKNLSYAKQQLTI